MTQKYGADYLLLRGKRIPVELADVRQSELRFYPENPRLYSILRTEGKEPTQEEVEEVLCRMDHVKQLVQSIKENGGLMDPVIVQSGTNIVLEGNSRLAAYRLLAKKDPIEWGRLRARILPAEISETDIFALLGEYHIIGKKDWAPYEQAGFLFRRHRKQGVQIAQLAKEINLSQRKISHLIDVYEFMSDHKERDVDRWSYYDEYLKSSKVRKAREKYPTLDSVVIAQIRSNEIPRAVDVRDNLKKIVEAGGKVLEKFVAKKQSFSASVEAAGDKGAGDQGIRRVKKFKDWLGTAGVKELPDLEGEPRKQCIYELKRIQALINRVMRRLEP